MPPHRHYEECASTNDLARAWALDTANPAPHGALVSADFQTRGRGRRGKHWQAQPGESVLMSVVLRPTFALPDAWQLAFVAALAVSDALQAYASKVTLKWPNDILIGGNKAAGVLVETVSSSKRWAAIAGIGINIGQVGFDADVIYTVPPTSLMMTVGHMPPIALVTGQVASALEHRLEQHSHCGWPSIRDDWRACMALDIALQRGQEQGIIVDMEPDGQALVRLGDGTFHVLGHGRTGRERKLRTKWSIMSVCPASRAAWHKG